MTQRLTWGILGTGNIARQFAVDVNQSRRGTLTAVASRDEQTAQRFAQTHGIPTAYGDYRRLLDDPSVAAVYVSLPNSLHHQWTLLALAAGKHVLCEKPLALTAAQARDMFAAAAHHRRVLVEAFMYRAHPLTHAVLQRVRAGDIGELRMIRTSFCYRMLRFAGNIRCDPALGGGALMDVGCYCLNFSHLHAAADLTAAHAVARTRPNGIDEITVGTLQFANAIAATFTCGMTVQADNTAYLCGSEGFIEVPVPWKPPSTQAMFSIVRAPPPRTDLEQKAAPPPAPRQTFTIDAGLELYALEADAFAATVLDHEIVMVTPEETLANMATLDDLRRQIGATA